MPVYLLHGFRWHRIKIRYHVIGHNIDDAAPEWLMAPATSIALLKSFYTLYDFLPPLPLSAPLPRSSTTSESTDTQSNAQSITISEKALSFNDWSVVKLVEQYDPNLEVVSQPYAYVGDYIVEVQLGVAVADEILKYEAKVRSEERNLGTLPTDGAPDTPASGGFWSPTINSTASDWFEKLRDMLQKDEGIGWFVVVCGDVERSFPSIESGHDISDSESAEDEPIET